MAGRRWGAGPLEPDEWPQDMHELLSRGDELLRDSRALLAELDQVLAGDDQLDQEHP